MVKALPVLHRRFAAEERYERSKRDGYTLLPFRFNRLDRERVVLTNLAGEHHVMAASALREFTEHKLLPDSPLFHELESKHFLTPTGSTIAFDLLATKVRTKQNFLDSFTGLFMFVTTLRCDHSCPYCQVSRQSEDKSAFDMTPEMADRAIEFMFRSPSPAIKVEFQGGESLLNFDLIRYIVRRVEERNEIECRDIQFVIATNLSPLTDEHLAFCLEHGVLLSTSLDGPESLHNANRPKASHDSHARAVDGIRRARAALGHDAVAALMTTTEASLTQPRAIVDEYVAMGFGSVFLRSISPYGFAKRTGWSSRYGTAEWLAFYKDALGYIIELNHQGVRFREEYTSLILRKMLTPWGTGYVDLQSPAGIGISCLTFNYDGDIYASDESRMLAETGDKTFRLGNLFTDTFDDVMGSPKLHRLLLETMVEATPVCCDCAYVPYCGTDPVFHHATQGDPTGHRPSSAFCAKNMGVINHLVSLLEDDPRAAEVLREWA
ncbi:MAG: His-Xaa-Ser system radical SAM maturase HxsB [Tepidisphaeraceae bacterium]